MKKTIVITSLLFSLFTAPAVLAEMVNINTADVAALDSLDGIGEKKAEAIVAYRTEHGEFKTLEDLKEVSGIGDKMFDKIKAEISLTDDASTVAATPASEDAAKTAKTDKVDEKAEVKTDVKTDVKAEAPTDKAAAKDAKAEPAAKTDDKVSDKAATKADKS